MIISIPSTIRKEVNDFTFVFSVIPPIITLKNADEDVKEFLLQLSKSFRIDIACENRDKKLCYPAIFGGIFVFNHDVIIKRYEITGYLCNGKEETVKNVNQLFKRLEEGKDWCFKFNDNSILCYKTTKESKECKWIDNIGLRFLILST
ncbi:hypothetical protein SULI_01080 [Saccharolobus solfataricus]|uniref:Uncharacterized protein n=3 Tax=Saccharolobus solfataricus TaxID=2287 RepID=Q97W29_SACS2|nr:hypothetical protein [Saccharolobus solfataricus]AAK42561.1 Hypothetical protein SSO2413 [Saccharolobus solfataricus P2]AKA72653.1 hypothetical protein SULB_0214 [Saccharolobus solfataricus]AKA75353.1 hypothetical protein SULC_0213 [Saccharolobus solfataricus]AKA78045.1 hypothetical protein SULA_0213 [Saccharolobus solfataricus]AZF67166.1 hypothetical protein SULG_01080 [Saccharolobus solfataricus]